MRKEFNIERAVEIGKTILDYFKKRKGVFSNIKIESRNDIGMDKEIYLNYITFISSIDYAKGIEADVLWKEGKEWVKKYRWLFLPNELFQRSCKEVMETFLIIRKNSKKVFRLKDIGIWLTIASTLQEFEGKTSKLLERFKKGEVIDAKRVFEFIKDSKEKFPYLSGDKILPMWIKILKEDGGVEFKNMDKIPLPVDRNVARVTYNLIFHEDFNGELSEKKKEEIREVWKEIANRIKVAVIEFDTPLWFLGGKYCSKRKCRICSFKKYCRGNRV